MSEEKKADSIRFDSYPEGYEKAKSMLTFVPEEARDAFMKNLVHQIITN